MNYFLIIYFLILMVNTLLTDDKYDIVNFAPTFYLYMKWFGIGMAVVNIKHFW